MKQNIISLLIQATIPRAFYMPEHLGTLLVIWFSPNEVFTNNGGIITLLYNQILLGTEMCT